MDAIKKILEEKEISVYRMAKDLGLPYSNVHQAMNGKAQFYPKYRKLISKYLGVSEEFLFKEEQ